MSHRNIIQLRPPSGNSSEVCKELRTNGYLDKQGPNRSGIDKALNDFLKSTDVLVRQRALRFIANSAAFPQNHRKILESDTIFKLVDYLSSNDAVNRSLSCMALSNLSSSGK